MYPARSKASPSVSNLMGATGASSRFRMRLSAINLERMSFSLRASSYSFLAIALE